MRKSGKNKFFSKRNIVAVFIVLIMVFSFGGLVIDQIAKEKHEYEGFRFLLQNNKWFLEIDANEFEFDSFPTEVEHISADPGVSDKLSNVLEIDITSDLNDTRSEAISLMQYSMSNELNKKRIYIRKGAISETDFNIPVITCKDATSSVPVIYVKSSNETRILLEGDCVIAESKNSVDFIKIKDRLLYAILGVMD